MPKWMIVEDSPYKEATPRWIKPYRGPWRERERQNTLGLVFLKSASGKGQPWPALNKGNVTFGTTALYSSLDYKEKQSLFDDGMQSLLISNIPPNRMLYVKTSRGDMYIASAEAFWVAKAENHKMLACTNWRRDASSQSLEVIENLRAASDSLKQADKEMPAVSDPNPARWSTDSNIAAELEVLTLEAQPKRKASLGDKPSFWQMSRKDSATGNIPYDKDVHKSILIAESGHAQLEGKCEIACYLIARAIEVDPLDQSLKEIHAQLRERPQNQFSFSPP